MKAKYAKVEQGKAGLMPRIPTLWAFFAVDEDGDEGIAAYFMPATALSPASWLPMLAADEARLEGLKERARGMAATGTKLRLVKFTTREDLEVFE